MSVFIVPVAPQTYDLTEQVELDGSTYTLSFFWNNLQGGWYVTIGQADGTPIVACRLVVNFPLAARTKNPNLPPGQLMAFDSSNLGVDPGMDDLGTRVQVVYMDAAEMASPAAPS